MAYQYFRASHITKLKLMSLSIDLHQEKCRCLNFFNLYKRKIQKTNGKTKDGEERLAKKPGRVKV